MFVIRKKLYATEGAPSRTRVNPDTGEVETTPDDGVTWVPDPRSDPRQNPAYQLPPPVADDVRCAAAAGMVENIRKVVAAALAFGTAGGLATVLIPLLLIPGIGWMYLAMLIFASVILILGGGAIAAQMTEEVYDRLLCIFVENIDADGRVSWAQLEAIHGIIASEYSGTLIPDFIGALFQYQREVGVTNAGAAYADSDADCSLCARWAELMDFRIDAYGFAVADFGGGPIGEYVPGVGFRTIFLDGSPNSYTSLTLAGSFAADITDIVAVIEYTQGACSATGDAAGGLWSQSFANTFYVTLVCNIPDNPMEWHADDVPLPPVTITQLIAQLIAGTASTGVDPGGEGVLVSLRVCGVGAPPGVGVPDDPC